jgi:hypothetical protein
MLQKGRGKSGTDTLLFASAHSEMEANIEDARSAHRPKKKSDAGTHLPVFQSRNHCIVLDNRKLIQLVTLRNETFLVNFRHDGFVALRWGTNAATPTAASEGRRRVLGQRGERTARRSSPKTRTFDAKRGNTTTPLTGMDFRYKSLLFAQQQRDRAC